MQVLTCKSNYLHKNALPHTQKRSMLKVTRFFVNQTFIALGSEGDIKLFRAVPLQAAIQFGTGWRSITKHAITQQSCPRCGSCSLGFNQRGSQIFCYSKALLTRMKNYLNADKDTRYRQSKYFCWIESASLYSINTNNTMCYKYVII